MTAVIETRPTCTCAVPDAVTAEIVPDDVAAAPAVNEYRWIPTCPPGGIGSPE